MYHKKNLNLTVIKRFNTVTVENILKQFAQINNHSQFPYLSLVIRTALIVVENVISKTNFFVISSNNINMLSGNLGLDPPDTIAIILDLNIISQMETLPIISKSKNNILIVFTCLVIYVDGRTIISFFY